MILFLALAAASPAFDQKLAAAANAVPASAKSANGFAPPGWQVQSIARGDLNRDGIADLATVLVLAHAEGDPAGTLVLEPDCYTAPAMIVVALGRREGGFRKAGVNRRLFAKDCELSTPDAQIRNNVLIVNHNWRDGWAVDLTYRFRIGPSGKLKLIGYDFEHYSRSDIMLGSKTSENYLDGRRIEYAKRNSSSYSELKRTSIPRRLLPFEDATMIADEGGAAFRPF